MRAKRTRSRFLVIAAAAGLAITKPTLEARSSEPASTPEATSRPNEAGKAPAKRLRDRAVAG